MDRDTAGIAIERIQTRLVKRRVGESEPYEIIETDTHYDEDGHEIAPPETETD